MASPGQNFIGLYRLVRLVRSSQTCQVWEAIHDTNGRRVALKVLQAEHRKSRSQINSMRHEYNVAHGMDHENIVHIFDFSVQRDIPFLTLEFFTVRNLKQAIQEGVDRLAPMVPEIIQQAASGLEHFHQQGWLHCDVKPDNFLAAQEGQVKLIDFSIAQKWRRGLARLVGGRSVVRGTRSYMSPEQIRGESLDPRSDLYSFGCVMHELVCGRVPYTGFSADDLLNKHLRAGIPSLLAKNDNVTPEFAELVMRTLAKDREQRPGSMKDFLREFEKMRVFRTRLKSAPPSDED